MRQRQRWIGGMCAALWALAAGPAAGISLGQVDDFSDGTLQSWAGGAPKTNVATGGPAGAGDRFLQVSASGGSLGMNNAVQWTGNYLTAGVTSIVLDLQNLGSSALALRVALTGPGGTFTTVNEVVLGASSGWTTVGFGLGAADLVQTAGAGTLGQTLANVTSLLLRHDPDPVSPPGESNGVSGVLGVDNIRAVPEPGSFTLVGLGLAALAHRRRRTRQATALRGSG